MRKFHMTRTLNQFGYFSPSTLEDALDVLRGYKGKGVAVLAGGTDLVRMIKDRVFEPSYIVSIKRIADLDFLRPEEGTSVGALTKISALVEAEEIRKNLPALHQATQAFGTPQVRNMATIGGNICRSSPSADTVPPLMVYGAQVVLVGPQDERRIPLEDFFKGPGENVMDNEILTKIVIPQQEERSGSAFAKITRNAADLAKINGAVKVTLSDGKCADLKIVLGSVGPTAIRAKTVETSIKGKSINDKLIGEATKRLAEDIRPVTDARSTARYRAEVSQILIERLLKQAVRMAQGK